MKEITITPRTQDRKCKKCGKVLLIGDRVMVQRTQSGGHYCLPCGKRMFMD